MNVLDLFSGIGGFSLGLERAGMRTVAFCEIEPFCRAVLAKHWPGVPCYDDIRTLTADKLGADGIAVDVICGGFPCQDISTAGRGAGIGGERSGLWKEYARLIGELRPHYVIVENVAALLSRGLDVVLGDLATLGYDAEWHCIPASAVGAHHRRDRLWLIADTNSIAARGLPQRTSAEKPSASIGGQDVADATGQRRREAGKHSERPEERIARSGSLLADSIGSRQPGSGQPEQPRCQAPRINRQTIDALASGVGDVWRAEPNVGRVAHGVPARMDRLRSLGNSVVPAIPEIIGRAIMNANFR